MKTKNIAVILALGLAAVASFGINKLYADAQGGNNTAPPIGPNGYTLNTQYATPAYYQAILRNNLGGTVVTGSATATGTSATVTPYPGMLLLTSSGVKIFISATNGLSITSGSVGAISGTNYSF